MGGMMKYKVGDKVLIKATITNIEINQSGVVYGVMADKAKGRFLEKQMILDETQDETN